jgi:hypothetical protein
MVYTYFEIGRMIVVEAKRKERAQLNMEAITKKDFRTVVGKFERNFD